MDLTELWTNLIRQIKSYPNVNASQIDAFFSRVQLQAASQGFVMFTSDNSFIKDWIEKHYIKDIQQALHDMYGMDFIVQIEVDPTSTPIAPLPESAPTVSQEAPVHQHNQRQPLHQVSKGRHPLLIKADIVLQKKRYQIPFTYQRERTHLFTGTITSPPTLPLKTKNWISVITHQIKLNKGE